MSEQQQTEIDPGKVEFVVIDLETTSREAAEAHIVEWAAARVVPEWFGTGGIETPVSNLVRPPIPIPPETSAIHHITDADVVDASTLEEWSPVIRAMFNNSNVIGVAHNAQYERTVLAPLGIKRQWLCTYKAALRVWPECPSHSNECLRYWLGLGGGRSAKQTPHSAAHDVMVTAQILRELLGKASLADMLRWTDEPALLPRCPIGDWRGHPWPEVDDGFLSWILRKSDTMREDVVFCARTELKRRDDEYRAAHPIQQPVAAGFGDDDLPF